MTENRLHLETSPYLLQHENNPVHWMPWGEDAFALAKENNKPVLLSIGYAACHWCHVMAHESFEDQETADLMNDLFINIKVDREERPDVDKIYMTALHEMGEQGGWPMTMFLTPEGEPFWGGTYFPIEPLYGRPSFKHILKELSRIFHEEKDKVRHNADAIRATLNTRKTYEVKSDLSLAIVDEIAERFLSIMDAEHGGLQGAPKFPQCSIFELLWRAGLRSGRDDYKQSVVNTLTRICQGGIYDHLGGGFARYSVDHRWLAPHFEKMLYDNAQLLDLMTLVWLETRAPLLRLRIEETVGWLLREMIAEAGAFAASLDADSEGVEGKYYVWQKGEIDALLDADQSALLCRVYDVSDQGNWEETNILNRLHSLDILDDASEAALASARQVLFDTRETRIRPGWDDKVLSDWNGLMISALANASAAFDQVAWLDAATAAFETIEQYLIHDGHLMHSLRLGKVRHFATAEGYANMIRAGITLYEVTGNNRFLERAEQWADEIHAFYLNEELGGYHLTSDRADTLIARTRSASDDATPNANSIMLANFARLFAITGKSDYRSRGDSLIATFQGEALAQIYGHSSFFNGFEIFVETVQCVLAGDPKDPATIALKRGLFDRGIPNRSVLHVETLDGLPEGHPAYGKSLQDGKPTLYVCRGTRCSLPVTRPEDMDGLGEFL